MAEMSTERMIEIIRNATAEIIRLKEIEEKYLALLAQIENPEEEERKQIGWIEREEGYYPIYTPRKGQIVTHAFILCKHCGTSIYHCMGPKYDAVCLKCKEKEPELR